MKRRITTYQYMIYGLGVAYFMLDQFFNLWLQPYYIPPSGSKLIPILSASMMFLALVIIRGIDALSDLIIGSLSDRSKSKMGKRSFFMFLGALPLGLATILFFYPPKGNDYITFIYFVLIGSIYFISYTLVGAPYNAMVADFSENEEQRLNLSTAQSIFRLIFTAIPLIFSGTLISLLGMGNEENGIRYTAIIFSVLSTVFVYLCIFLLKEPKLSINDIKKEGIPFFKAIQFLKRKDVILYFIGFFFFFCGFNVIRNVLPYYSTLILNQKYSFVTTLSAVMFGASAIFFPITNMLSKKFSSRNIMVVNLLTIIIPLLIIVILKPTSIALVLILFFIMGTGFSGAAFIFPPAMLSSIASNLSKEHNVSIEGFMFGIQGFCLKLAFLVQAGITTLGIVYGSNVIDGKKTATTQGVILAISISIILLIISMIFYYINKTTLEE